MNVHRKGEDRKAGDRLVSKGTVITPAVIGTGASIGKTHAMVTALPRVVILSTGDELVEIGDAPQLHIR
ncbi:MAG: hypothetical protein R2795_11940 [Saprospiraceae bacterium]